MKKLVALLLTFLLVLTGCQMVEVTKVEDDIETDAIRFSKEYDLDDNENVYKYATYDNVMDIIKNDTGIIYLGFPTCALCKEVIPVLNDVAKEKDVKEILYYNFKDIRDNNTTEYQELAELLSDYIKTDDEGYHSISQAQQARGVELGKNERFFSRLKNSVNILLPLILTSLNRIDTISNAMELRGFGKNKKRTWYTQRPFARRDFLTLALGVLLLLFSLTVTIKCGRFYNPFC